jgi:DME family drug/metabolite transporter
LSPRPGDAASAGAAPTLAVIAASIAFGTTGTAQAKGPADTTPLGVGATRILVGAVGLIVAVAVIRWRSRASSGAATAVWTPRRSHALVVAAGGAGVALYQPTFFAGTERSGVAIGTIVALGSGPAFVGLYETLVLRRRPSPVWLAATSLALAGGALLVASQAGDGGRFDGLGVLCSLAAGMGYAVYASAAKTLLERNIDSSVAMAWIFAAGAVLLLPALVTEPLGWLGTRSGVAMVAHLGLVTVTIAYLLYGFGLRTLATSTAVTLTLAEPVTAALAGIVVLDERLAAAGWLGAAMVVTGLALTGVRRRRVIAEPAPL